MAIRTLLWAKDQTVITQTVRKKNGRPVASVPAPNALDKLVLVGIGDEASEHTWDALLGVEDLAVFVGCTRRAVQESLRRLERAGFIRCRTTRVESGRSGWQRIFLLADESPLVKGLIEVDFSTVEMISRFQMRTFRDRAESSFVPSDSRTRKKDGSAGQSKGERGSPSKGRVNEVRPPRVNEVHPEGERGSPSEGERGSSPFFSTDFSSPSKEGRTDGQTSSQEQKNEPEAWALELVVGLDYGKHRRPSRPQAHKLARLVMAGRDQHGLTERELRRHCRIALNEATRSGVSYLQGALDPERLPVPASAVSGEQGGAEVTHLPVRPAESAREAMGKLPATGGPDSAEKLLSAGLRREFLPTRLQG